MKDPIEVAATTPGMAFTLDSAMAYVCRRGISPPRSREVARQVLACYQAGVAPTFAATYNQWIQTNTLSRGEPRVLH